MREKPWPTPNTSHGSLKEWRLGTSGTKTFRAKDTSSHQTFRVPLCIGIFREADKLDSRSKIPLAGADLSDANLSKADLTSADLSHANLTLATLTGSNLWHADLTNANLHFAELAGANLTASGALESRSLPISDQIAGATS